MIAVLRTGSATRRRDAVSLMYRVDGVPRRRRRRARVALIAAAQVKPTFIAARAVDLSKLGNGAYVELKDMQTAGYDGIRGLILARAENHPDRWAVAPIHKKHKKTVAALKHERPLAIKDSSLVVVDASEDEDSEDDVEDAD